jgi:aspartyl-tRNA(Asn)/glutamyl-tRNA(Gln) amidotransferase subunit B
MSWEVVIGLEIHVQMATKSKLMCHCDASFSDQPNSHICPVCSGQPGMLPVINKEVIESAIKLGLATNCSIRKINEFARKNYFYPDLPKGYQISQYDKPICEGGNLLIEINDEEKNIGITRIHIEEDAGKLVHVGSDNIKDSSYSLSDLNRSSVPLCEIVSEPDMRSAEEAKIYAEKIRQIVRYLEISDGNMEEGSLRCDANISIRKKGSDVLGTKTEVKNLNSFKSIERAINLEVQRQIDILEEGGQIIQETRHYNESTNTTKSMRTKEDAHDYRYFPDPDLVPIVIEKGWIDKIEKDLPELPNQKIQRYINDYSLTFLEAKTITTEKTIALFFEEVVSFGAKPRDVLNWIMSEVLAYLNKHNLDINKTKLSSKLLYELLKLIDENVISGKIAKKILPDILEKGENPKDLVDKQGLVQVTDTQEIQKVIEEVIKENQKVVEEIKAGNKKAIGFLVGQVMQKTSGKANPGIVSKLLSQTISSSF